MYDYSVYENKKAHRKWMSLFRIVSKILFKIEIIGEENISSNNFLLSVNHISHIDFIFAPFSKRINDVHFFAMSELFRKPLQGAFMKSINCFPAERGNGKANFAVDHSVNLLKRNFNVGIFPEGVINRTAPYAPQQAKRGVARIALESKADVLPCSLFCKGKVMPFKKVIVSYGRPIHYSELKNIYDINNDHCMVSEYIFNKTKLMWEEASKNA